MDLARKDMKRVEFRKEMKSIRSNGECFHAVVIANREKLKGEENVYFDNFLYCIIHQGICTKIISEHWGLYMNAAP